MKLKQIEEILECLPGDRTKFYYFKDRYALMLLSFITQEPRSIHAIKKSRYKRLLDKPIVKDILKKNGQGVFTSLAFDSFWPDNFQCYLLTLDTWGNRDRWYRFCNQTSRPGWNLVLQLNFSSQHNRAYTRLLKPQVKQPFQCFSHPVAENDVHTLAWARLDMDLERGEALIEEIQTDWVRLALRSKRDFTKFAAYDGDKKRYIPQYVKGIGCNLQDLNSYIEEELQPHIAIWQEAMLASAIWFLKEEIGISKIFYHTFDFGCKLKRITGRRPPRSLYTQLPSKFCFEKTNCGPEFLVKNNNRTMSRLMKEQNCQFYVLEI